MSDDRMPPDDKDPEDWTAGELAAVTDAVAGSMTLEEQAVRDVDPLPRPPWLTAYRDQFTARFERVRERLIATTPAEWVEMERAEAIRRHVSNHLVYFSPDHYLRVSTVLRTEMDPLNPLFDLFEIDAFPVDYPYETAVFGEAGPEDEHLSVARASNLPAARVLHKAAVAGHSGDARVVMDLGGWGAREVRDAAAQITATLARQEAAWGDRDE